MDCVIAVGPTSHDDFELRYCLRSLSNLPLNQVYTVGRKPSWLHNTHHLLVPDPHPVKDCNIITKILCCCALDISDPFVFISDDQLIINKTKEIPYTHGADLTNQPDKMLSANNWYRCLLNSRNKLRKNNINTFIHHDTHCPIPVDKKMFPKIMLQYPIGSSPGYGIFSLYFNHLKTLQNIDSVFHSTVKATIEKPKTYQQIVEKAENKLFLGYNDAGLNNDLKKFITTTFSTPSKYE